MSIPIEDTHTHVRYPRNEWVNNCVNNNVPRKQKNILVCILVHANDEQTAVNEAARVINREVFPDLAFTESITCSMFARAPSSPWHYTSHDGNKKPIPALVLASDPDASRILETIMEPVKHSLCTRVYDHSARRIRTSIQLHKVLLNVLPQYNLDLRDNYSYECSYDTESREFVTSKVTVNHLPFWLVPTEICMHT